MEAPGSAEVTGGGQCLKNSVILVCGIEVEVRGRDVSLNPSFAVPAWVDFCVMRQSNIGYFNLKDVFKLLGDLSLPD